VSGSLFSQDDQPISPFEEGDDRDFRSPFEPGYLGTPQTQVKQVWSVGGGKGGVGKSLVSSSLAIGLARMGHRVVSIDLDLGGANLHTTLGVDLPKQTLSDFFGGRTRKLEECISPTPIPNLDLISGAQDRVNAASISFDEKVRFLREVRSLPADYVVFDLGAGTSTHTLDFFLFSDLQLLTLLPEPTSIENGYRFIKSTYYRKLRLAPELQGIANLIEQAMEGRGASAVKSPSDLFREVNRRSSEMGMKLKAEIESFRPKLIVNQARTQTDIDIGFSVKTVCKKYFGIEMDYIGYLDYDSSVWQAIRRKRPVMLEFPNAKLVSSLERMVDYLLKKHPTTGK
jgi:flagellar biosynthesis protein FlhG